MNITVNPITRDVEIVTDMQLLSDIVDLTNTVNQMKEPAKKERDRLASLVKELDSKTLVLTLKGLPSSPWNAIVIEHTDIREGRAVKDPQGIVADALPRMMSKAAYKGGEPVSLDAGDIESLVGSLTDTQVAELIQTIQTLNTPIDALPKEVRDLIG